MATWYCSDVCKWNQARLKSGVDAEHFANAIRRLLGMPDERSRHFTLPELQMMHRRIERLLPCGALAKTTKPQRRRSA